MSKAEIDGVDWVRWIYRMMMSFPGFGQGRKDVQAVALGSTEFRTPQRFNLLEHRVVVCVRPDGINLLDSPS